MPYSGPVPRTKQANVLMCLLMCLLMFASFWMLFNCGPVGMCQDVFGILCSCWFCLISGRSFLEFFTPLAPTHPIGKSAVASAGMLCLWQPTMTSQGSVMGKANLRPFLYPCISLYILVYTYAHTHIYNMYILCHIMSKLVFYNGGIIVYWGRGTTEWLPWVNKNDHRPYVILFDMDSRDIAVLPCCQGSRPFHISFQTLRSQSWGGARALRSDCSQLIIASK